MATAVKVAAVRAPMHMAIVALTPGSMPLAVFVIAMDAAIDVTAIWIPMHMTMMMVVLWGLRPNETEGVSQGA